MEHISKTQQQLVAEKSASASQSSQFIKKYLINPVSSGLMGFAAFFTLILLSNLFTYVFGISSNFVLGIDEVLYSAVGFVLVFSYKFLENFQTN